MSLSSAQARRKMLSRTFAHVWALALKALPKDVGVSDGIKLALKALGK